MPATEYCASIFMLEYFYYFQKCVRTFVCNLLCNFKNERANYQNALFYHKSIVSVAPSKKGGGVLKDRKYLV